jgi:Rrf2 family protein
VLANQYRALRATSNFGEPGYQGMNRDRRLSDVLHVLLHLDQAETPRTSDALAASLGTNAAAYRRMMTGLREAGYVRSEKGHGGGWTLARSLAEISLLDVYSALGRPSLFAIGNRSDRPDCLIERNVNGALKDTMAQAESLLMRRFSEITLDRLLPEPDNSASTRCR